MKRPLLRPTLRAIATALLLVVVLFALPSRRHSAPRFSALEEAWGRDFPSLRQQLSARAEFSAAARAINGKTVTGVTPVTSSPGRPAVGEPPILQPPSGMQTAEQAAWLAVARRNEQGQQQSLRPFFPATYTDPFEVEAHGMRVTLRPLDAAAARAQVEGGKLIYRQAYPDTDSLHAVTAERSEEFLLLHSAAAPRRFAYELTVAGAARVAVEDGKVRFVNARGQGVEIERPWVIDACGERSDAVVRWELGEAEANGTRQLALELDAAGLSYPLVIDPSWSNTGNFNAFRQSHTATLLQNGKVLVTGGSPGLLPIILAELYDPDSGSWTTTGSLNAARMNHTATLLPNGKVLVVGGTGGGGGVIGSAELYDPVSGIWTTTGLLNTARNNHTATLLPNGKVLVAGGLAGSYLSSAELYDPALGTWSTTGSLTTARDAHTTTLLPNGKILVAGGFNGISDLNSAELYDSALENWSPINSLTMARAGHTATLLPNGNVLVAGGYNSGALSSAELYNPALGNWNATGSLTSARYVYTATLLPNGKVLVAGGFNGNSFLSSAELYDPALGNWSETSSLATARRSHTATLLPNGKVFVAGGRNGGALNSAELYDPTVNPSTGSWANTGSLNTARYEAAGVLLPNGKYLIAGGRDTFFLLNSAELYDSATDVWTATGNLNQSRRNFTATLLANGKVLVVGGDNFAAPFNSAELYDPATGVWTLTGSLNTARTDHTATLLPNGKVLVVGGLSTSGNLVFNIPLAGAELYDPATGVWSNTNALNVARGRHTATLLPNGKVLVAGGYNGSVEINDAALYDPASGSWTTVGNIATARSQHTATLLPNGKVLVAGGGQDTQSIPSAELFNSTTNAWSLTSAQISGHSEPVISLLPNGKVFIAGGSLGSFNGSLGGDLYDPETQSWSSLNGLMSAEHRQAIGTLLPNGKMLVAGGSSTSGNATNVSELYDFGLGFNEAWRPTLTTITSPLSLTLAATATGNNFKGISEASGGGSYQNSSTNYPLLQLRSLANEQSRFLPLDTATNWSDTSFTSTAMTDFPPGYAMATVITNGIPSLPKLLLVTSLNPAKQIFSFSGGTGQVMVKMPAGHPWLAVSNVPWLTITGGSGGSGNGTVNFSVAPGIGRTGTLTIAGQTFTVEQPATVTKTADSNDGVCDADCSLREAIAAAEPNTAIIFSALFNTPQTITLSGGELLIEKNLTINGQGLLTVSGNNASRVFHINSGATVSLTGLTVTGGNAIAPDNSGGGILNQGVLTITNCQVSGNTASAFGGGIFNYLGTLTVTHSTIANNTANASTTGGGIDNLNDNSDTPLTLLNTTISGNTVTAAGGLSGGGLWTDSPTTITNCTITNNSAAGANSAGGVQIAAPTTIRNSIIAANQNNAAVPDVFAFGGTSITSHGFNLIGNRGAGTAFNQPGDQTGTGTAPRNPGLGLLQNNGGPTATHALLVGSPALDAGNNTGSGVTTDQRGAGFPRTVNLPLSNVGDGTDIGAFEAQSVPSLPGLAISDVSMPEGNADTATTTFTVTLSAPSLQTVTVQYASADGTATAGSDYVAVNGTLTFNPGVTSQPLNVTINGDTLGEADETFLINLTNPVNAVLSDDQSVGRLSNDDTLLVLNANDSGPGSLRQALSDANTGLSADTILFEPVFFGTPRTINLASALPFFVTDISLIGPGANLLTVRRDTGGAYRIFTINTGVGAVLSGLTISGGNSSSSGGGIRNFGTLLVRDCQISGNTAATSGGGISSNNSLIVTNSTIANNTASSGVAGTTGSGGGIHSSGSFLTLLNTTISGNLNTYALGSNGGGVWTSTTVASIDNCTITNNTAAGPNSAGGVYRSGGFITLRNTLIAANQNNTTVPDVFAAGNTGITSNGFNLIGNRGAVTAFNQTGDQAGTSAAPFNPLLAALGNYGGPAQTHALLPGSPAINAGTNVDAPATDGRGIARPQQTTTDIGAFESRGFTLAVTSGSPQSALPNTIFANPLVVSVTPLGAGEPANGGRVMFTPPGAGASCSLVGNPATIASGQAGVMAIANNTLGAYNVAASANVATTVNFALTNSTDISPPTASASAANVTASGGTAYTFTVTYSDNNAINVSTLGNGNVNVSGPGGFNASANFLGVNNNNNGTPRTATYQITPPGGTWDGSDSGTYTVVMNANQVADTGGNVVAAGTLGAFTVSMGGAGLQFYPLAAPVRLLDTRTGASPNACSQPNTPIAASTSHTQTARGFCGIPSNAQAITGNVTTVQSGGGYLTLYPSDAAQPAVANTNYGPNEIINNVFTVGLGNSDGGFKIFALSTTDVVVDVTGYYAPPGAGGLYFHPLPSPVRLLETRNNPAFPGCIKPNAPLTGSQDSLQTATTACTGIPATARAVVGNATTVSPQGGGYLTLFPADATRPLVAGSNYNANQVVNGPFTTGLSATGQFKVFTVATTDLVVDLSGYYSGDAVDANGAGLLFTPLSHPVRLLETRAGQPVGCFKPGAPLNASQVYTQSARGVCDGLTIPSTALGVVGNATVILPQGGGYLTLWPSSAVQPTVATANYNGNDVVNRHFIVGLGNADGAFKMFSPAKTDLVIDLSGYFAP